MAMSQEDDESARAVRILRHMNSQHKSSLVRFLQHFAHLSSFAARNPKAVSIDNSSITIAARSLFSESHYAISFDPPLSSLADARSRLVWLDEKATESLGHAPDTVTRYIPPHTPVQVAEFVGVILGLVAFSSADNFLTGTWLTATLLRFTPAFARLCYRLQPLGLSLIVGIHTVEASIMAVRKLGPHTVPTGSRV